MVRREDCKGEFTGRPDHGRGWERGVVQDEEARAMRKRARASHSKGARVSTRYAHGGHELPAMSRQTSSTSSGRRRTHVMEKDGERAVLDRQSHERHQRVGDLKPSQVEHRRSRRTSICRHGRTDGGCVSDTPMSRLSSPRGRFVHGGSERLLCFAASQ